MKYRSTRDYFDEKYQIQKYYFEEKLGVDIAPCIGGPDGAVLKTMIKYCFLQVHLFGSNGC